MKKPLKITLIVILVIVLLTGGVFAGLYFFREKGQTREDINIDPADNTYIDDDKNIADCTEMESLFIFAAKLKKINSYYATVSGEVDAGGIYKQTIGGEKYKSGEDAFYNSYSKSLLKNTAEQIFIERDVVLVRKGDHSSNVYEDSATKYDLGDYLYEYGTDFREVSNYELNEKTIKKGELVSVSDGVYTFRYEIDVETGVNAYRVNMAKMGDLSELPIFIESTLEVAMTEDFMPVTVKQTDKYSINMIITLNCTSTLVETFERFSDGAEIIPEFEFFKSRI